MSHTLARGRDGGRCPLARGRRCCDRLVVLTLSPGVAAEVRVQPTKPNQRYDRSTPACHFVASAGVYGPLELEVRIRFQGCKLE